MGLAAKALMPRLWLVQHAGDALFLLLLLFLSLHLRCVAGGEGEVSLAPMGWQLNVSWDVC
jgi:hypothetical protein